MTLHVHSGFSIKIAKLGKKFGVFAAIGFDHVDFAGYLYSSPKSVGHREWHRKVIDKALFAVYASNAKEI